MPSIEVECKNPRCRAKFFVWPSNIREGKGVYCSNSCRAKRPRNLENNERKKNEKDFVNNQFPTP